MMPNFGNHHPGFSGGNTANEAAGYYSDRPFPLQPCPYHGCDIDVCDCQLDPTCPSGVRLSSTNINHNAATFEQVRTQRHHSQRRTRGKSQSKSTSRAAEDQTVRVDGENETENESKDDEDDSKLFDWTEVPLNNNTFVRNSCSNLRQVVQQVPMNWNTLSDGGQTTSAPGYIQQQQPVVYPYMPIIQAAGYMQEPQPVLNEHMWYNNKIPSTTDHPTQFDIDNHSIGKIPFRTQPRGSMARVPSKTQGSAALAPSKKTAPVSPANNQQGGKKKKKNSEKENNQSSNSNKSTTSFTGRISNPFMRKSQDGGATNTNASNDKSGRPAVGRKEANRIKYMASQSTFLANFSPQQQNFGSLVILVLIVAAIIFFSHHMNKNN